MLHSSPHLGSSRCVISSRAAPEYPQSVRVGFFLTLFPPPLPHDGKPAAKFSQHSKSQEEVICLSPVEVGRVNVKAAEEHPVPLTQPRFLSSLLLSNDFLQKIHRKKKIHWSAVVADQLLGKKK